MEFVDLKIQLEWFNKIGVEKFNFSVLTEKGMINHNLARTTEEVMTAAGWAWAKNKAGLNVYLRPAVGFVQPVVLLDDLGVAKASDAARKSAALVLETSRDNTQVWVHLTRSLNIPQRAAVQRHLIAELGADPGSASGDHFGRAADFRNRKPGRGDWAVRIVAATARTPLDPTPYLTLPKPSSDGGACASSARLPQKAYSSAGDDESRKEWGWAMGWLRSGQDVECGIQRLTIRALERGKRSDQKQARAYAELTFRKARSAFLSKPSYS